ncbi:DUF3106 domain-containing protein [Polynucleobacter sp. HIN7]|uniref:DUF3106 domain-containing protein n=1 Tax=Polynucleobacter sp. HIN7 TaxID=3047866 RepID=UPI0025736140|nr:DUF3106 domain-containing protein [Polynucleobacter sp. HIN7]BEI37476.1 hypothetical protein PHIN7_12000 [Polynucleobacter sp. HIN7]
MQFRLLAPALLTLFIALSNSRAHAQNTGATQPSPTTVGKKVDKLAWNQLNPLQQTVLAPLESDWETLSNDRKTKWIRVANRYPYMTSPEQERLQGRMADWAKLPQKDRRIARDNYLTSLQIPAEQKAAAWEAYQQLSEEEKQKLAQQELNKRKSSAATAPAIQPRAVINTPSGPAPNSTIK